MPTLYTIESDMMALDDLLFEAGGDISDPEVAAAVDAMFAEMETNLSAKADGYANWIAERNAMQEACKAEAARLADKARLIGRGVDALKGRLKEFMERRAIPKIETPHWTISVCKNGGMLPIEIDTDVVPVTLPEKFQYQPPVEVNKEAVRQAIEHGEILNFARAGERGTHLRLR